MMHHVSRVATLSSAALGMRGPVTSTTAATSTPVEAAVGQTRPPNATDADALSLTNTWATFVSEQGLSCLLDEASDAALMVGSPGGRASTAMSGSAAGLSISAGPSSASLMRLAAAAELQSAVAGSLPPWPFGSLDELYNLCPEDEGCCSVRASVAADRSQRPQRVSNAFVHDPLFVEKVGRAASTVSGTCSPAGRGSALHSPRTGTSTAGAHLPGAMTPPLRRNCDTPLA